MTLRFPDDAYSDEKDIKPPAQLLFFLEHLQVSYDASYIAAIKQPSHFPPSPLPNTPGLGPRLSATPQARLSPAPITISTSEVTLDEPLSRPPVPPRSQSMRSTLQVNSGLGAGLSGGLGPGKHPSIFPPHTPHPVPAAAESDRAYVQAQGTLLRTGVWGEGVSAVSDAFVLLRDSRENTEGKAWVAVFKMCIAVCEFSFRSVSSPSASTDNCGG